jgi:uncharacterized membrane-anchored protein YjiN (DUF445 family)
VVDERLHAEALRLVREMRDDPGHRLRRSLDEYLTQLADRLQHDEATIERLETAKGRAFDDPRIRELAASTWAAARAAAMDVLSDEDGELGHRAEAFVADVARRILADDELRASLNTRLTDSALHLVTSYRSDISHVITETVQSWDPAETTEKIETQIGRDLQFIRINGTVVGALAGLAIYSVAAAISALF